MSLELRVKTRSQLSKSISESHQSSSPSSSSVISTSVIINNHADKQKTSRNKSNPTSTYQDGPNTIISDIKHDPSPSTDTSISVNISPPSAPITSKTSQNDAKSNENEQKRMKHVSDDVTIVTPSSYTSTVPSSSMISSSNTHLNSVSTANTAIDMSVNSIESNANVSNVHCTTELPILSHIPLSSIPSTAIIGTTSDNVQSSNIILNSSPIVNVSIPVVETSMNSNDTSVESVHSNENALNSYVSQLISVPNPIATVEPSINPSLNIQSNSSNSDTTTIPIVDSETKNSQ